MVHVYTIGSSDQHSSDSQFRFFPSTRLVQGIYMYIYITAYKQTTKKISQGNTYNSKFHVSKSECNNATGIPTHLLWCHNQED